MVLMLVLVLVLVLVMVKALMVMVLVMVTVLMCGQLLLCAAHHHHITTHLTCTLPLLIQDACGIALRGCAWTRPYACDFSAQHASSLPSPLPP